MSTELKAIEDEVTELETTVTSLKERVLALETHLYSLQTEAERTVTKDAHMQTIKTLSGVIESNAPNAEATEAMTSAVLRLTKIVDDNATQLAEKDSWGKMWHLVAHCYHIVYVEERTLPDTPDPLLHVSPSLWKTAKSIFHDWHGRHKEQEAKNAAQVDPEPEGGDNNGKALDPKD